MDKKMLLLASFVLVILIKDSEGIQCYECSYLSSTTCNDPFDKNAGTLTTCAGDVSCLTTKIGENVNRSCYSWKECDGCSSDDPTTCYCNTDGCNPAVTTKLSAVLLVFVSLAYLFYSVF